MPCHAMLYCASLRSSLGSFVLAYYATVHSTSATVSSAVLCFATSVQLWLFPFHFECNTSYVLLYNTINCEWDTQYFEGSRFSGSENKNRFCRLRCISTLKFVITFYTDIFRIMYVSEPYHVDLNILFIVLRHELS